MTAPLNEPLDLRELGYIGMKDGEFICKAPGHVRISDRWCDHLMRFIMNGQDAEHIYAGQRLSVPVFPSSDIFAEIVIGKTDIPTGAGLMWMEFTPDVGRMRKESLGFWNPGEGMWSIRAVISDWLKAQLDPNESFSKGRILTKCPSTATHGMKESRLMKERAVEDSHWKAACLWNIVMEKACTPCMEISAGDPDDNFGMPVGTGAPAPFRPDPIPF